MKTLIVEDDFASRQIMHIILSPYTKCEFAVNGIEALEACKQGWNCCEPYDLICLDIMMPEMDGYEVLKEVRRLEIENGIIGLGRTKIIIISALCDPRLIRRAFQEGCEAYLTKPINKQELLDTLLELGIIRP